MEGEHAQSPALEGLTVLDASRVLAGPYCTMLLADLGADVIKVERPHTGDDTRAWGPPYLGPPDEGLSAYYLSVNRMKRSLCLDLKNDAGRDLFLDLLRRADVLVENFAPGTAERLGLEEDTLAGANPNIVHCSITAFGEQPGPGYDLVIQGMSGLMSITGQSNGPPMKVGVAITDVIAGLQAASAILAAVVARQCTGRGDRINISLLGSAVAALVNVGQAYLVSGDPPRRWGNAHPQIVPYQVFASADGYLTVAAGNDKLFTQLCDCVGRPDLASDARFATNPQRVVHRDDLVAVLEPLFVEKSTDEWLDALTGANVPCGPVADLPQLFHGEHPASDGARLAAGVEVLSLETSGRARYRMVGPAARMSGRRRELRAAPRLGEHTDEVLRELLRLDDAHVEQLRSIGAIQ